MFTKLYLHLLLMLILVGITSKINAEKPSQYSLKLVSKYKLNVPEPSGLSLGENCQSLWTVSDPPSNKIYELNLKGDILRTLDFKGNDLEGVVYDSAEQVLWIVEESKSELIKISLTGKPLDRFKIKERGVNHIEGICITPAHHFWIINEKAPGQLLELNTDFTIKEHYNLNVAKDYSGICSDSVEEQFWIVSDESRLIFRWNVTQGIIEKYKLPFKKAEGIAVDYNKNLIYIVSDSEETLFIFKLVK